MSELETLPRDVSRLAYTQRILEIVGNIRKQKEEITKVRCHGHGGWVLWADLPKGQMRVVWPHRDSTLSDGQSHPMTQSSPTWYTPVPTGTVTQALSGCELMRRKAFSWSAAHPRHRLTAPVSARSCLIQRSFRRKSTPCLGSWTGRLR